MPKSYRLAITANAARKLTFDLTTLTMYTYSYVQLLHITRSLACSITTHLAVPKELMPVCSKWLTITDRDSDGTDRNGWPPGPFVYLVYEVYQTPPIMGSVGEKTSLIV